MIDTRWKWTGFSHLFSQPPVGCLDQVPSRKTQVRRWQPRDDVAPKEQ